MSSLKTNQSRCSSVGAWNDLHRAIVAEDVERVISLLEDEQTDVDEPTPQRQNTPLHLACMDGQEEIVTLLLAHGAQVDVQNADGETPLHFAVRSGSHAVIRVILREARELLETTDLDNLTPLHWAVLEDDRETIKLLLAEGADVFAETLTEGNAAFLAATQGSVESLEILLEACPALLQSVDDDGNSLLHLAASLDLEDVVRVLLAAGVRTDLLNDDDETAEDVSVSDTITALIQCHADSPLDPPSSLSSSSSSSPSLSVVSSPSSSTPPSPLQEPETRRNNVPLLSLPSCPSSPPLLSS